MSADSAASVGWGIVGCGRVAARRIAPAIVSADNARLVAFCSRSLERASEYMERYGAELAFDDLAEMVAEPSVQAIYVATPNALHGQQAIACLSGGKHVLVDKPMATSVAEARRMVEQSQGRGRWLSVMLQMRYHPANQWLMQMVQDGRLGSLSLLRAQMGYWFAPAEAWRQEAELAGGGVVMDLAPHAIDLLRQIGGDIAEVQALTANVQFRYDVEDVAMATVRFEAGPVGRIDVAYCTHEYGGRLEVLGSQASVAIAGSLHQIGPYRIWHRQGGTDQPVQITEGHFEGCYRAAIEEFSDAILQRRQPAITAADGLRNMEVIAAIYESARLGRPVRLEG